MQFELTDEFFERLQLAIDSKDEAFIESQLKELYPPDIAEIFNKLELEQVKFLYNYLDEQDRKSVV